jgi:hypothetical protein
VVADGDVEAERSPAAEITDIFHQHWELETVFDELYTHSLERLEALSSQIPHPIRQALFALAGVNGLESWTCPGGQALGGESLTTLYWTRLLLIRTLWLSPSVMADGQLPQDLDQLAGDIAVLLLPAGRPRSYPESLLISRLIRSDFYWFRRG